MGLFDFFKKKKEEEWFEIYSPLNGKVIDLSEVPDPAFAQKWLEMDVLLTLLKVLYMLQ